MNRPAAELEKVLIRPNFGIHFCRARRTRWSVESCPNYTALFMLKGEVTYQRQNEHETLSANSTLLFNPGDAGHGKAASAEYVLISISSSYVVDCAVRARLIRSGAVVRFVSHPAEQNDRLSRLLTELREEIDQPQAGQELVIAATIEQVVVQLLRHYAHVLRSDNLELSRAGLVDRRIRRAVELMQSQLHRDLPLDEIASAAYLSPFHFSRLFKKLTGATPHSYLSNLRISHAQLLLADSDMSITEISARAGYASSSHFSKAFRSATGMTPRVFRAAVVKTLPIE